MLVLLRVTAILTNGSLFRESEMTKKKRISPETPCADCGGTICGVKSNRCLSCYGMREAIAKKLKGSGIREFTIYHYRRLVVRCSGQEDLAGVWKDGPKWGNLDKETRKSILTQAQMMMTSPEDPQEDSQSS